MATAFLLLLGATHNPAGEKATPSPRLEVKREIHPLRLPLGDIFHKRTNRGVTGDGRQMPGAGTRTRSGAGVETAPAPHTSGRSRTWGGTQSGRHYSSSRPLMPPNSDATRPTHMSVHTPHPASGQQQGRAELYPHSHPSGNPNVPTTLPSSWVWPAWEAAGWPLLLPK